MKHLSSLLIGFLMIATAFGQSTREEIEQHRADHLTYLLDTASGWLNQQEIEAFEGLDYFDFDSTFQVTAKLTKKKGKKFKMPTSTERLPVYRRYGFIDFTIGDSLCRLEVYQNMSYMKENKRHLFVPFRDATTRELTYGGGRYLDLEIPKGDSLLVDFNFAYNPYCAYTYKASCPIPPAVNTLSVPIRAGEKTPLGH